MSLINKLRYVMSIANTVGEEGRVGDGSTYVDTN